MIQLRYGDGQVLRIRPPAEAAVADFGDPRGRPLDDPAAAVAAALADPLDFPPLQRATTPGDRVVLAVDRGVPQLDAVVAGAVHALLYLLLLAMPIVGWWATSAYGAPISVFWLFELPPLVAQDKAVAERVFALHGALGLVLIALVAAHAGAALHHHFVKGDGILRRML